MAAVVVASPLHILVQHVLQPLERQQLTVRPGFEPQACRVPTQRGIYLFSVTVDIIQARRTCTAASNCPYHHVFWRAACALAAASAADAHAADAGSVCTAVSCTCVCRFAACCGERGPRPAEAIFECVILAGSLFFLGKERCCCVIVRWVRIDRVGFIARCCAIRDFRAFWSF